MELTKPPKDASYVYFSSNPIQYEEVVIIDPTQGAYARFPLRLLPNESNLINIQATFVKKMFGPLKLRAGQYIYGADGSLIGVMVTNQRGKLFNHIKVKQTYDVKSAVAFMKSHDSISEWDKKSSDE
jgi:hypothetical protein